jgi:hypothetical protein
LTQRGWFVGRQAEPPGIHLHLNPAHSIAVDDYLSDLRDAVTEVRKTGARALEASGRTY